MVWVKGHKGIEEADKLCSEAPILGHEVVTSAGLRAWGKRVRAEVKGMES